MKFEYAIATINLLTNHLRFLENIGENDFSVSSEEIISINKSINPIYTSLFEEEVTRIKINDNENDDIINIKKKDTQGLDEIKDLIKNFDLPLDSKSDTAFDILDSFLIEYKNEINNFKSNLTYDLSRNVKGGYLYQSNYASYNITASFDFELNLLSINVDNEDYTTIINDNLSLEDALKFKAHSDFHYHRAKKNYSYFLRELKIGLGLEKPIIETKSEGALEQHRILKYCGFSKSYNVYNARLTDNDTFNRSDIGEKFGDIIKLNDDREVLYSEYQKKIKEFSAWKQDMESKLIDVTYGEVALKFKELQKDMVVLYNAKELMIKALITSVDTNDDGLQIVTYKLFNMNGNLRRKELTLDINEYSDYPFYFHQ